MRISKKCFYGIRALLALARAYKKDRGTSIHLREIAEEEEIPYKFLEHVMASLKKGGLVRSEKGRNGGYILARSPAAISMGEVIRLIDGPPYPGPTADEIRTSMARGAREAGIHSILLEVRNAVSAMLDNKSFEDLYQKSEELAHAGQSSSMYSI